MDNQEIKRYLERQAEELMELAEKLSNHGRSLSPHECEVVRTALVRHVRQAQSEQLFFFLDGNQDDFHYSAEELHRLLEQLS